LLAAGPGAATTILDSMQRGSERGRERWTETEAVLKQHGMMACTDQFFFRMGSWEVASRENK
jgi:hypothetical protein